MAPARIPDSTPRATLEARIDLLVAGRFRLTAVLGQGGAGYVYRAEDQQHARAVAVKIMRPEMSSEPDGVKRFLREAQVARRMSHPNVVAVLDAGQLDQDGSLYLAMELVDGGSLSKRLADRPMDPARAVGYTRQILLGLAHAHGHGIVHRDVKPDNVLIHRDLDGNEQLKLADFGLAADAEAIEKLTAQGIAFGTPEYISPEMALGHAVDGRADLYAVGVMLFEMLTGRRPFDNADRGALLRQHVYSPVPSLASVAPSVHLSPNLWSVVERALVKKPADRYPDAAAMLRDLDAATGARPAPARLTTPSLVISGTRGGRWWIGGLAAALVAAAVAAWLYLGR